MQENCSIIITAVIAFQCSAFINNEAEPLRLYSGRSWVRTSITLGYT